MKTNKGKDRVLYQDQRIAEEFCNFRCEYCEGFCPSGYSLKTDSNGNLSVPKDWYEKMNSLSEKVNSFFNGESKMIHFYEIAYDTMQRTKLIVDTDILKISGGEITTNKNLIEFIERIHNEYPTVQILSNGFNLKEDEIRKFGEMGNITFQISLDGVTPETNHSKSYSARITEKVVQNIDSMLSEKIPVEINCVLTRYNTSDFLLFLEKFKDANNFMIVPRPVRGEPRKIIDFSKEQSAIFKKNILENYPKYMKILPPLKYFERLIDIMEKGIRNYNCYIPYFVLSIDGYGNFEKCPLGLLPDKVQNVIDGTVTSKEIMTNSEYKISDNNDLCKYCIVQYEMLNLYVEGEISKEELKRMPSISSDTVISHIDETKQMIILNEIKRKITEEYLLQIDNIEKNEESSDGNVYIIQSKGDRFVVKLYKDISHTISMTKLHSKLFDANLNVPQIIKTKNNEMHSNLLGTSYIVVYSFMKGKQISELYKNLDNYIISLLAKKLRKFHKITSGDNEFNLPILPFANSYLIKRCSALHFDLTRGNIFFHEGNIGLIDFDDTKYGPSLCDVAILIANMFFSKSRGVEANGIKRFINEYYQDDLELKLNEIPFIKSFAIEWINYILDNHTFDTSTTESLEVRRKLIDENLFL